jgi:hypothetical protein
MMDGLWSLDSLHSMAEISTGTVLDSKKLPTQLCLWHGAPVEGSVVGACQLCHCALKVVAVSGSCGFVLTLYRVI